MRFKNTKNNVEISNLIFEYLRLNNTDELMEHDPELFDWNHWDIKRPSMRWTRKKNGLTKR